MIYIYQNMSYRNNKLPKVVETLINLDEEQINLISDTILINLTNTQLREIQISKKVNQLLIDRIREVDKKYFRNNMVPLNTHDYWRTFNNTLKT